MSSISSTSKLSTSPTITVTYLPAKPSLSADKEHHLGSPRTHFQNPPSWDSHASLSFFQVLATRFSRNRNFVPVPEDREGLPKVQKPDWGLGVDGKFKATWIGHASWLLETAVQLPAARAMSASHTAATRGVRVLCDPVFSERTSPFTWFGPKRYTPTPCTIAELPEVDVILISHSHYDHLDATTIKELLALQPRIHICCPLGNKSWFLALSGVQFGPDQVTELDWWDGVNIAVPDIGSVDLICTPAQHTSARTGADKDRTLWASWVVREGLTPSVPEMRDPSPTQRTVFFAGDTGYRRVLSTHPTPAEESSMPHTPAFALIGTHYGPFDLALLPIGLAHPRDFMSSVHCAPEDAVCLHRDLKSKRSVGMHYGTVRGGISEFYEDVREPGRRWRECAEEAGLRWGVDVELCDVGETVLVD